jgi:aerobic carbon-monoxide dehydrogenase medium subunit
MQPFELHRPATLSRAAELLKTQAESRLLAGGMTLIPSMKMGLAEPPALVDLSAVAGLAGIRVEAGALIVGAMTRHADVAASPDVVRLVPALAELAGGIGDPQVRHRGTLGGSIANNDPSADYPAALLGLSATVVTNVRAIPADAFFTGMFDTALAPGEIVTEVRFPIPVAAAYTKFKSPASRYALVGVFMAKTADGVRVAVTGAAPCVFRAAGIEAALAEKLALERLDNFRFPADGLNADLNGDAGYRAHLVSVLARRTLATLLARLGSHG